MDTIAGEMITKIQHIIDAFMNRIRPQSRTHTCFAKQEEFCFVLAKTPSKKPI